MQTWRRGLTTLGIAAALLGHTNPGNAEPSPDKVAAGQLLALVNQERAAAGLAPLALSDVAVEVAEAWSVHMATTGVLAHNESWFSAETKERAGAAASGENVAHNVDIADAHARLMNSPHHRANILDSRFHQVGIGVVRGDGTWWITEDFLQSRMVERAKDAVVPVAALPAPPTQAPPRPSLPPAPPVSPPTGSPSPLGGPAGATPSTDPGAPATLADLEELGRDLASFDLGEQLPEPGDGIEVASGRGVVTPAARSDMVPSGLVAVAVAGLLVNAAGVAVQRRRRVRSRERVARSPGRDLAR